MKNSKKRFQSRFYLRDSLLTELFKDHHTRNLYNVYLIVFTALMVQMSVAQYVKTGSVNFGFATLKRGFTNMDRALLIWLCCILSSCSSFFIFKFWWYQKNVLTGTKIVDGFFLVSLVTYYFYCFKFVGKAATSCDFNPPCIAFVTLEMARILMKVHSFVRSNATKVSDFPTFSHFLYFVFVPTLIYKDDYPRTKEINWSFARGRLFECASAILILVAVSEIVLPFCDGSQKVSVSDIVLHIFTHAVFGTVTLLAAFLIVLHSCQNFFAEIMRFGDRHFYGDWWNAYNFSTWLTKWNLIVQEWLYQYVYLDFREYVYDNAVIGKLMVFFVSFSVHEWVMYFTVGGFFPLMFTVSMVVVFPTLFLKIPQNAVFNVLVWYLGSLVALALIVLYSLDYYARINAPVVNATFGEMLFPRFVTCDCILAY